MPQNEITNEEILQLIVERGLTVERVIDTIVDANKLIGVGLVSLGETLKYYTILNAQLRLPGITREDVNRIIREHMNAMNSQRKN